MSNGKAMEFVDGADYFLKVCLSDDKELKICTNGDIIVNGRVIKTDDEFVAIFKEYVQQIVFINRKELSEKAKQ